MCPVNITELHMRGSVFRTGQWLPHHRPPQSSRPILVCDTKRKLFLFFFVLRKTKYSRSRLAGANATTRPPTRKKTVGFDQRQRLLHGRYTRTNTCVRWDISIKHIAVKFLSVLLPKRPCPFCHLDPEVVKKSSETSRKL
jgi:hypothetical protein